MNSTHKVEIVPVVLEKHGNADSLSVVNVFGGYPCCVRTADWSGKTLAAYLPPDSVVDVTRPEFAFLASGTKTKHRIRAKKLRGVQSFGLLMPAPDGAQLGDDVAAFYGVEHYEPEIKGACTGGEAESAPGMLSQYPKYDIDAMRRYTNVFTPGEPVYVSEKIHGANARYSWFDGRMWCGSRTEWKKEIADNLWWRALANTPSIRAFCEANPGSLLYGEVFGQVQNLKYGAGRNDVWFAAFDILRTNGQFDNPPEFIAACQRHGVARVPVIAMGVPFDINQIYGWADGQSLVEGADHFREGCVVKPMAERWHQAVGRVVLKVVGAEYLEKA